MSVGLFDGDMSKYHQVPFNLELMKLSSFYKKKGEIVQLSPHFSPERYGKFFYRQDYYDGTYPEKMETYKNLVYGGYAFSGNKYIPMEEEIEEQKPDTYIYERMRNVFVKNKMLQSSFNVMMRAEHLRLSLDGKSIWNKFQNQIDIAPATSTIILHDHNLSDIDGALDTIENLSLCKKKEIYIGAKFPIELNSSKDLLAWGNFKNSSQYYCLQYNGIIDDSALVELVNLPNGTKNLKRLECIVTASSSSENDFIDTGLQRIFKQVIFLRRHRLKISLRYEDDFFTDKRWETLLDFFNTFASSLDTFTNEEFNRVIDKDSLFKFSKKLKDYQYFKNRIFTKPIARELFKMVYERNYELFKDFYECKKVHLEKGRFVND